ncbi:filamentous hemagglutinin N-terminal domain-containing protein, partial [Pseudomonas aeruginosa]
MNKCYALVWNVSQGCWNVVSEGSRRRGKPAGAKAAIASALALLGATALAPAYALPSGGTVVGGSANGEIHLSGGNSLSVNQKVDKLIANWDSFSVAAGERVIFNQPSSSSIALNRVIGTKASDIQGRIDANGQVFLVNPNGVLFGRGAQVNVGGLVASTLDITDAEFNGNSSRYRFTGPSTNGVLNHGGAITAAEGGSIALLGAQVDNRGTVLAQMGGVGLGAGSDLTLNFDGNKLLDIRVDAGVANALASNGGLLKADGGRVLMAARTANALLNTVVNSQGAIEARSLRGKNGRIVLDG